MVRNDRGLWGFEEKEVLKFWYATKTKKRKPKTKGIMFFSQYVIKGTKDSKPHNKSTF
jgi:hypothetical protein